MPGWGLDQRPICDVPTRLVASYVGDAAWTASHPIAFRRRPTCEHGLDLEQMVLLHRALSTPMRHFELERDLGPSDAHGATRDSPFHGP